MSPRSDRWLHGLNQWQSLVGLGLLAFAYMGGKVLWPANRIEAVATASIFRDSVLTGEHQDIQNRLDSLTTNQEQIIYLLKIVALDACLGHTAADRRLMQLPCSQLMNPRSPIIQR